MPKLIYHETVDESYLSRRRWSFIWRSANATAAKREMHLRSLWRLKCYGNYSALPEEYTRPISYVPWNRVCSFLSLLLLYHHSSTESEAGAKCPFQYVNSSSIEMADATMKCVFNQFRKCAFIFQRVCRDNHQCMHSQWKRYWLNAERRRPPTH